MNRCCKKDAQYLSSLETKFLEKDENFPSSSFLRTLVIECQQELNTADNEQACQNVKDKQEPDVHKMLVKISNAEKPRPYLVNGVGSQDEA
jgi:hypothetical protein